MAREGTSPGCMQWKEVVDVWHWNLSVVSEFFRSQVSLLRVHHHSMQILSCCSRYELRHWSNWRCPQTAEVQTCCVFLRVQYDRWMWHFVVSCGTQQLHSNSFMTVGSIRYFCMCYSFPFKSFIVLYLISTVCCLYFTMILSLDSQVMLHIVYYTCVLSVYIHPIQSTFACITSQLCMCILKWKVLFWLA